VSQYQKGKTKLDLLKQETVSGSGISWAVCKSAPHSRQITMPTPHHLVYYRPGCPSCEHQQPLNMCFVDFKKAFDSISHDKLWVTMMDMEYPLHLIDLLAKLYKKQLAKVKVAGTLSE